MASGRRVANAPTYCDGVEPALVRPLLRGVRRVRAGALDLQDLPAEVSALLRGNLAGACRAIVLWADAEVHDPRAADAFVRTYGLGRMPESRATIGRSLRSATGRRGISVAAVDDLVRATEVQLARQADRISFPGPWGSPTPQAWVDPFPTAGGLPGERRELQQVLCTAWADVPDDPVHECSAALLLYEEEHGLRHGPGPPRHREQRRRLRRLAWSMLTVARERHVGRQPDDVVVDLLLGPRRVAVVEELPPEAAAALLAVAVPHSLECVEAALEYVRDAVRHGRPEAPELLALLRESIAREPNQPRPANVTAGIAALSTIVARENRQPAGVMAANEVMAMASEAGDLLSRLPARQTELRRRYTRTLNDGLRAAQEVAELHDALGNTAGARRALCSMSRLLRHLDPEDQDEVQGWQQQHHQTRSTVARHAASPRHAEGWLRLADCHARRSSELADAASLPAGFRLVPASQLAAAAIARLRASAGADGGRGSVLEQQARARLAQAEAGARDVEGPVDRPTHSARLSVSRRWWELALLCGDPDEIVAARRAAHERVVPCTLPHDLHKLARLEAMSRAQGVPAEYVPTIAGVTVN
jgi:hypothetical protein